MSRNTVQIPLVSSSVPLKEIFHLKINTNNQIPIETFCCSLLGRGMSIWIVTSLCDMAQRPAPRPSSTCGRCALVSVCPPASISLYHPPLSPTKMETSACASSLKNRQSSSEFLDRFWPTISRLVLIRSLCLLTEMCLFF